MAFPSRGKVTGESGWAGGWQEEARSRTSIRGADRGPGPPPSTRGPWEQAPRRADGAQRPGLQPPRRGFSAGQRRLPHVSGVLLRSLAQTPSVGAFFILRKSPLLLRIERIPHSAVRNP